MFTTNNFLRKNNLSLLKKKKIILFDLTNSETPGYYQKGECKWFSSKLIFPKKLNNKVSQDN